MRLLIGLPVFQRAWCLKYFFEKIEALGWPEEDLGFCFLYGPSQDTTLNIILDYQQSHPKHFAFNIIEETQEKHETHIETGLRHWSPQRYEAMSRMRNRLLDCVTGIDPDVYLSLDSDLMLETPNTFELLIEDLKIYDLVGIWTYMTVPADRGYPSVMTWDREVGGHATRKGPYPTGQLFDVDIVMAGKAMKPEVFRNVRYYAHPQGEDLGFSANAKSQAFRIGCDSRIFASHVMGSYHLQGYLLEGDPRNPLLRAKAI